MRRNRFWQILLVFVLLLFEPSSVYAEGGPPPPDIEEEGPAPPPPAAPINEWVPFSVVLGIGVGFFFIKKKLTIKSPAL